MGPTFTKFGQSFANRSDIINKGLSAELLRLCDNTKSEDFSYIKATIESQLGKKIEEIFAQIDQTPTASASIAQVHKATTKCGKAVAVKVLKKNIEKIFKQDIRLIVIFAHIISIFLSKRLNIVAAIQRFARSSRYELNLTIEAASASELKENTENDVGFLVPQVFWGLTSQRVLVTEWIDGTPLTKFDKNDQQIVNRLILIFFKQVYRDGFFHADVHPGNIFITRKNEIAVVDFGIMGRVDKKTKIYLIQIVRGFLNRDYHSVAEVHFKAGHVDRKFLHFATACRAIGEPIIGKPLRLISIASLLAQVFKLASDFEMEIQPHLLLLQKNLMLLEGNCAKIAPDTNMWNVISPFIKQWHSKEMAPHKILQERLALGLETFQSILDCGTRSGKSDDFAGSGSGKLLWVFGFVNLFLVFVVIYKLCKI